MTNNINLFKGAKGDPYVIPQADIDQALTDYINSHPTDFVKSVNGKSNVIVLNQGDIQSGPLSATTGNFTSVVQTGRLILSNNLNGTAGFFTGALSATSATFTGALSAAN